MRQGFVCLFIWLIIAIALLPSAKKDVFSLDQVKFSFPQ